MGRLLRILLTGLAAGPVAAFFAVFFEPFFGETLKRVGINSAEWVPPVMTWLADIVSDDWFRLIGGGIVGAAVGAWLHWGATKFDKRDASGGGERAARPGYQRSKENIRKHQLYTIGLRCEEIMNRIDGMRRHGRIGQNPPYADLWAAYLPVQIDLEKFRIKSPDGPIENEDHVETVRSFMLYLAPLLKSGHLKESRTLGRNFTLPPKDPHAGFMRRIRTLLAHKIQP